MSNFDGNLLIPRMFERWVGLIQRWMYLDTLVSVMFSLSALRNIDTAEKQLQIEKDKANDIKQMNYLFNQEKFKAFDEQYLFVPRGTVLSPAQKLEQRFNQNLYYDFVAVEAKYRLGKGAKLFDKLPTVIASEPDYNAYLGARGLLDKSGAPIGAPVFSTLEHDFNSLPDASKQLDYLAKELGLDPAFAKGITENAPSAAYPQLRPALEKEILQAGNVAKLANQRLMSNFVLGMLWLGIGRYGFEVANGVTLTGDYSAGTKGTSLRIYANDFDFASAFRRGTDWILSGYVTSMISDFVGTGIPNKLFGVDKVVLIQTPGDTGTETGSQTSLSTRDGSWAIRTTWQGDSQATFFEDTRDGKGRTSLAVQANYLTLGGTIKRRKELSQFYEGIAVIGPILAWRFIDPRQVADARLLTVMRLVVMDLYINDIVNPENVFQRRGMQPG